MLDRFLNFVTIIAWVLFGAYSIIYFLRAWQQAGWQEALKKLFSFRFVITLFIIIAISLINISMVFLEPQEVGVVISLFSRDGYRQQPMRSGLHWITPLAEQVVRYPISWQNYTMSSDPLDGAKQGNDTIAARSSDGQEVFIDSSAIFQIDPNEVIRVHIEWQGRYMDDFIRPLLRGLIRTEVSQFTADEINSSKRKVLESNLDTLLREALREKGFNLDRFLVRKIAFSPEYAAAVEAKQVAEQKRLEADYQAAQMRKLAEGQRDKMKLEAEGRASAKLAEGEADAKVIVLRGQAEAQALKQVAQSLEGKPNLLTYRYIDKLSPSLRAMLVPNNNPFLLPLPDILNEPTAAPTLTSTVILSTTLPVSPTLEQATPEPTPRP